MKTLIALLLLLPSLSWGLGENIKNNKDVIKDAIKEEIQNKVEGVGSHNNLSMQIFVKSISSVSSANKELIHQFKNNFTSIEDLEEALTSAVKEQGKDVLFQDIVTTIEKKIIVAENLYKKLNENDLKEITNLLIALRVVDKAKDLVVFFTMNAEILYSLLKVHFPMGIPCVESSDPVYGEIENDHYVDICPYVR